MLGTKKQSNNTIIGKYCLEFEVLINLILQIILYILDIDH